MTFKERMVLQQVARKPEIFILETTQPFQGMKKGLL